MNKTWGAALAVAAAGSALSGWTVSPGNASAATEKNSVYYHGTTREAQFTSRATCDAHARAEVKLVQSRPSQAVIIPALSPPGVSGSQLRTTCYPVASGHWSYLVAYFAKKGVALSKYDRYVDQQTRFTSPAFPPDDERTYLYLHRVSHSADYWSVATCNKYANATTATVTSRGSLRLLLSEQCFSERGVVGYLVAYAGPTPGLAVARGDVQQLVGTTASNAFPMLDVLGYDYSYLSDQPEPALLAERQAHLRRTLMGSRH